MPSWNEVRIGLTQVSKLRLLFLLAKVYRSSAVPKTVKMSILTLARSGLTTKRISRKALAIRTGSGTRKDPFVNKSKKIFRRVSKKPRSAAQKRATRKLIAFNKRRKR